MRQQRDYPFDEESDAASIDVSGDTLTRQEFKKETDINEILNRFGIPQFTREPIFGEVNFDQDLQQAHLTIQRARETYDELPEWIRAKYPTQESLVDAIGNGQLAKDMKRADELKEQYQLEQDAARAADREVIFETARTVRREKDKKPGDPQKTSS